MPGTSKRAYAACTTSSGSATGACVRLALCAIGTVTLQSGEANGAASHIAGRGADDRSAEEGRAGERLGGDDGPSVVDCCCSCWL